MHAAPRGQWLLFSDRLPSRLDDPSVSSSARRLFWPQLTCFVSSGWRWRWCWEGRRARLIGEALALRVRGHPWRSGSRQPTRPPRLTAPAGSSSRLPPPAATPSRAGAPRLCRRHRRVARATAGSVPRSPGHSRAGGISPTTAAWCAHAPASTMPPAAAPPATCTRAPGGCAPPPGAGVRPSVLAAPSASKFPHFCQRRALPRPPLRSCVADDKCCSRYEDCVSCCLKPENNPQQHMGSIFRGRNK